MATNISWNGFPLDKTKKPKNYAGKKTTKKFKKHNLQKNL